MAEMQGARVAQYTEEDIRRECRESNHEEFVKTFLTIVE